MGGLSLRFCPIPMCSCFLTCMREATRGDSGGMGWGGGSWGRAWQAPHKAALSWWVVAALSPLSH